MNECNFHEELIKICLDEITNQGFKILGVDHLNGHRKPSKFNGSIPDIEAVSIHETRCIIEVESCKGIGSDHNKKQHTDFKNYSNSNANTKFFLVVHNDCMDKAKDYARLWGTEPDRWWGIHLKSH